MDENAVLGKSARINVTINEDFLVIVDQFAKENFMTRSALIMLALSEYIRVRKTSEELSRLNEILKKMSELKEISDEDMDFLKFLEYYNKSISWFFKGEKMKSKFELIDEMMLFASNSLYENKLSVQEIVDRVRRYEDGIIENIETKDEFKQVLNHLMLKVLSNMSMSLKG